MGIKLFIFLLLFILTANAKERIISLSPSITEILYGLNAGENIVGTSSYSLYPKEALSLPIIGNYTNPNVEKILALSPSFVVGETFSLSTLEKLKHFHIKTVMLNLASLKSIESSIKTLAKAINKTQEAKKLLADITNAIKNVSENKHPHSVMIVYGLKEDLRSGIYIAGKSIFFNDIIELSGNTNAYTQKTTSQPVLNYENVIALNPDQIIILHSHATEADVDVKKALKNWYSIPTNAAREFKISIVDEDYLHIPSHRVALSISRLTKEMND